MKPAKFIHTDRIQGEAHILFLLDCFSFQLVFLVLIGCSGALCFVDWPGCQCHLDLGVLYSGVATAEYLSLIGVRDFFFFLELPTLLVSLYSDLSGVVMGSSWPVGKNRED